MKKQGIHLFKFRMTLINTIITLNIITILHLIGSTAFSQLQYTTSVVSESNVTSSSNSIDANISTYSELESGTGIIIGIGSYSSHIELSFPGIVPANQTSYVRIETQDNILSSLLGGTLGNLLSSIVGTALTGNQEFSVDVKNGASVVLSGSSTNPLSFAGERLKIVLDKNGHTFLAITPNQPYQSIRITNNVGSLIGLGVKKHMKVWDPYYVTTAITCTDPQFTSYDASGITLELLNLGGGITNLERVIDANLASHSTLSLGVVSVTSTITQRVYFEGLSQPTDVFVVRLGLDPALLAITLGQGIRIRTQNGAVVVSNNSLQSMLTPLDIVNLQNGLPISINLTPGVPVDRIVLEMNGLLGVTVSQSIKIYEVYKISPAPIMDVFSSDTIICQGSSANLIADAINPIEEIRWYSSITSTTPITITPSGGTFNTGNLNNDTTFYVASGIPGCPHESTRIPVNIDVIMGPDSSDINTSVMPQYCVNDSVLIISNSTIGNNFQWYSATDLTSPLTDGQQIGNHIFQINNDSILITGLTVADSPFSIYVSVQDSITGCWNIMDNYAEIIINMIDEPIPTSVLLEQEFCALDSAVIADLQINGLVNWYDAPNGGNLLPSNTLLTDSTSYYASSVGALCESSNRLEIIAIVNNEQAPTTNDSIQYFCVLDSVTVGDLQVNGGLINWYDAPNGGNLLPSNTLLTDSTSYYASTVGALCESSDRLEIVVMINDESVPTSTLSEQHFCASENATIEDLQVNGQVNWYDAPNNGNLLPSNTSLTNSTSYYASSVGTLCESSDRLEIVVMINDESVPTSTLSEQHFCASENATIEDLQVNGQVNWYDAPNNGNLLPSNTLLTDSTSYYASSVGTLCESSDRLEIVVIINDESAPTSTLSEQHFCASENATIEDLQVNGQVNWYDAPNNGNLLPSNTLLTNSTSYYASSVGALCESSDRLEIVVVINDESAPTTSDLIQYFCLLDSATVGDIDINGTSINWYDINGNTLSTTDPLIHGGVYYATNQGGICESSDSIQIVINISELPAPTTTDSIQSFCVTESPTLADLNINETSINWYDGAGNLLPINTPLVDSTVYYASLTSLSCESDDKLAILVVFETSMTATITGVTNNICLLDTVVYFTSAGMNNYQWQITGGTILSGGGSSDNTISVIWFDTINPTISVLYDNQSSCLTQTPTPINITVVKCAELTIEKQVNNLTPFIGEQIVFTITVSNSGQGSHSDILVNEVLQTGFTYVSHQTTTGSYNQQSGIWEIPLLNAGENAILTITVKVNPTGNYTNVASIFSIDDELIDDSNQISDEVIIDPNCLIIYNQISPNNDGVNDYFQIDCIEQYPENTLIIYNRYGNMVYSTDGYKNEFKGISNVSGVVSKGEHLPIGTYFYLLKINDMNFETSGWIYLVK